MTRNECEDRLIALVEQAGAVLKEYAPECGRLSMSTCDGHIDIMGWQGDYDETKPFTDRYIVYCTKFKDGKVYRKEYWDEALGD